MPNLKYFSTAHLKGPGAQVPRGATVFLRIQRESTMEVREGGQSGGGHKGPRNGPEDILVYTGIASAPGGSFQKTDVKQHFLLDPCCRHNPGSKEKRFRFLIFLERAGHRELHESSWLRT